MNSTLQKTDELIPVVSVNNKLVVDARTLHQFLQNKRQFANWIKQRIEEYGFTEGEDYEVFNKFVKNPSGGRPVADYTITLDMAKELAIIEENVYGKDIYQYLKIVEKLS